MRLLYTLAWWLALPLVLARLWLRGRQEPGYRQHLGERLGFYGRQPAPAMDTIWLHAVSVGETRAAEPLIDALLAAWPACRIVLTHMTPTGRATGKSLFAKHGTRLVQSYLPYDTGAMPARFIRHFAPRICILMETEVWPNLIHQCNRYKVPVVLANARLSQRSLGKAQRLGKLITDAARGITLVAAQTQDDADRVRQLGVRDVVVTGSIKFDVVVPEAALATGAALRAAIGARPVLLCASTREGEEPLILDAYARASLPANALLLIVPRHPQRFDEVEKLIAAQGLAVQRRSGLAQGDAVAAATQVLLGDSMGEMFAYYAACDCAFVGGSLLPLGGQNLIEPAALGKPVLIGPHTFNFALVTEQAIAAGGAALVADADALMAQASALLQDPARLAVMGEKALAFANQHRGATPRTIAAIQPLLP
ncbi:lipid IV(A) 3-deoxy-D-manno-octulosonic acid transferase [Janthinobacterium lividum]|uniref:lipid IV(A) 3-deoxy-D-manno-octulosonic acid transferase n=1 Tax=Janthinobacterium lividum TaxID=29581 RepID=UPI0008738579|nr:lipid IV(A) 3-deoxy-D-manno-octulosonic acid transferase [Janthinobacterium lividum]MCC7713720.1 lipid IV(A) 3-deoxy-D-manno-octulosonic acid transferase [Janthinobacterium lividum]OEZ57764.1 3-deoxy-D-manno-octulosonic acid transferase [Janthinobacterium lividum]WQE28332.1 lipid IV(A) 3-deoxy-D-manno-octulosonic acid transferase [Janthinobacterium lividum]STQ99271.1 3-deoxy-D-manno-octulosonic-acid transferase [Janthinobacterium lividum]